MNTPSAEGALVPAPANILVVDDHRPSLVALEAALGPLGQRVVLAENADQALRALLQGEFAVVLLDVRLPGLDGIELAACIKGRAASAHVPVILLSAEGGEEHSARGYQAGAVDFLRKPVDPEVLRAKVAGLVTLHHCEQAHRREAARLRARLEADQRRLLEQEHTARTAAEAHVARLERAEAELQAALRARDEFLSVASHELKTPLTPLRLRLQALARELPEGPARGHLEAADRQVRRLALLVEDLLDVSHIRAGRLELSPELVDLGEVVEAVARQLGPTAERAGTALRVRAEAGLVVHWDRERLAQVVSHLLANALRYGAGLPVELEAERVGGVAHLRVHDQGIGIAPDDQERIFGRCERASSERHYGGLGLGLYIVRQVVEAQGGQIGVRSEPGLGATFEVTLPLAIGGQVAVSAPAG